MRTAPTARILYVFAMGLVNWSATKATVQNGTSMGNVGSHATSQTSNAPDITVSLSPARGGLSNSTFDTKMRYARSAKS